MAAKVLKNQLRTVRESNPVMPGFSGGGVNAGPLLHPIPMLPLHIAAYPVRQGRGTPKDAAKVHILFISANKKFVFLQKTQKTAVGRRCLRHPDTEYEYILKRFFTS